MYSDIRTQKLDGRGRVDAERPTLQTLQHLSSTLSVYVIRLFVIDESLWLFLQADWGVVPSY